jgi:hypothetical protein
MEIILNVFYSTGQSGHCSRYSALAMGWVTKDTCFDLRQVQMCVLFSILVLKSMDTGGGEGGGLSEVVKQPKRED